MVAFVQEYDDTQARWDDNAILADTAQNSVDAPQLVTPVMTAFINLANAADSARSSIESAKFSADTAASTL